MGCGSSVAQVSDSMKDGMFKPLRLLDVDKQNEGGETQGKVYLFGQTRTQRKIIELDLTCNSIRSLSNRVRIPVPRIHYDPIELMYEQSQEIFHLGVYSMSVLPPFNKMLALYLQNNVIFLCGGKDFDSYNVKNQAFYYTINDQNKHKSQQINLPSEQNDRTEIKSKYSTNKFQKIAGMNVKRYGHMGIYIQKLKSILVFGGINQKQEIISSCQRYGVLDNAWKDMPSMHIPRAYANCFQFNNKVYLFGGRNVNSKKTKKIEVFHCQTNQWQILNFKLHRGIQQSLIFSQNPNEITIIGGKTYSGSTKSVITVNMLSQTLVWDSSLNNEYQSVKGIKTKSNIIVFGGKKNSIQIYGKNQWIQKKFDNKKIIQLDQIQLFSYSLQSQNVSYKPVEQTKKVRVQKDEIIIFGNDEYPCMLVCNLQKRAITKQCISMRLKIRSNMSIVQYQVGKYFLAGGCDWKETKSFNSSYFFDAVNNQFQQTVKMNQKKYHFAICANSGFIYIFGGYDSFDKTAKKSCARFSISNQCWQTLPTLRRARRKCYCLVVSNDRIAIFGGVNGMQDVAGIQILNINDKKFDIYQPNLHLPHSILCAYSTNNSQNTIYIFNRKESQNYQLTTVSLVTNNIHSNRSAFSSHLQTIDLNAHTHQQQRPQSSITQQYPPIAQEQSHTHKLSESKGRNQSADNIHSISIKPTFVQIKPKQSQSESSQFNQLNKLEQYDLEQSVQIQKVDLNKYNLIKQAKSKTEEMQIRNQASEHQLVVQKQQGIKMQSQLTLKDRQIKQSQSRLQQSVKVMTSQPINWLANHQYKVVDRLDRLYFLNSQQCIEFNKNYKEIKSTQISNCSNVSFSMIT